MFAIPGQTSEPNRLTFLGEPGHGTAGFDIG